MAIGSVMALTVNRFSASKADGSYSFGKELLSFRPCTHGALETTVGRLPMRAHSVKHYNSIVQVLSEAGCPICAFLKNVQSKLVQESQIDEVVALCNHHAWAIAAVRERVQAAKIFLALIEKSRQGERRECSICIRLEQEETLRIQELLASLEQHHVLEWIEKRGVLCIPHAFRMYEDASEAGRALIDRVLNRSQDALGRMLRESLVDAMRDSEHAGLLGKAAEYLVSQRGVSMRSGTLVHSG